MFQLVQVQTSTKQWPNILPITSPSVSGRSAMRRPEWILFSQGNHRIVPSLNKRKSQRAKSSHRHRKMGVHFSRWAFCLCYSPSPTTHTHRCLCSSLLVRIRVGPWRRSTHNIFISQQAKRSTPYWQMELPQKRAFGGCSGSRWGLFRKLLFTYTLGLFAKSFVIIESSCLLVGILYDGISAQHQLVGIVSGACSAIRGRSKITSMIVGVGKEVVRRGGCSLWQPML